MPGIIVIGSSNTDMVIKTQKLPAPGETILGGTFLMNPGGKGANQAVAAARLGGKVTFITKRGNDLFGNQAVGLLMREGIDTQYIIKDPDLPSGVALITVDSAGENIIVVAPGSNGNLLQEDIPESVFGSGNFDAACRKHKLTPRAKSAMEKIASGARSVGPKPMTRKL